MMGTFAAQGQRAGVRQRASRASAVVDQVEEHARQQAARLHRQQADDDAHQAGHQRLLEDAVGQAEEDGA